MSELFEECMSRVRKIRRHPTWSHDVKKMDTVGEKILVGIIIIYGGIENVPQECFKITGILSKK